MLCAPIPDALRSNRLIRANNTVDRMTLKQLRTGMLQGRLSGGVAAPHVALIDLTMHHPFGHCLS